MYISGKPGIGKTAVVMSVCAHVADSRNARGVAGKQGFLGGLCSSSMDVQLKHLWHGARAYQ